MCDGSSESDCMIASPRKMCVPGVHASAVEGVRAIATTAIRNAAKSREPGRSGMRDPVTASNADALSLTANSLSEIVQLVFDNVVNCVPGSVNIFPNLLGDVVQRDPVNELFTAVGGESHPLRCARTGPACAADCALTSPARAFQSCFACEARSLASRAEQWPERTGSGWTASHHQRYARTNRYANESCCQKVKLIVALFVEIILDFGFSGAAFRCRRSRCSSHLPTPRCRTPCSGRFSRHAMWTRLSQTPTLLLPVQLPAVHSAG